MFHPIVLSRRLSPALGRTGQNGQWRKTGLGSEIQFLDVRRYINFIIIFALPIRLDLLSGFVPLSHPKIINKYFHVSYYLGKYDNGIMCMAAYDV